MALSLQGQLVQLGDQLAEVHISIRHHADHAKVTADATGVNTMGHRWTRSVHLDEHDVACREALPEAARLAVIAALYDDPVEVVDAFVRYMRRTHRAHD